MKRDDLLRYMSTLEADATVLFRTVDIAVRDCADTLSEEFQLYAQLLDVFVQRATEYLKRTSES